MTYIEFADAVEKMMNKKMKGGVRASLYTAMKNNGKERTGILIEMPGINISPTIYLEEYYESYVAGRKIEQIVDDIKQLYEEIKQEKPWDCESFRDYEGVRNRIVFPLNQRIIAGNAQFTGIAAGRGVGFTTGLLLLREGLGMRETPIRPHSWH